MVDASPDAHTAEVVREFAWALRVSFPRGAGHMTASRNEGLLRATGDVIAFIDDDVNVHVGWLSGLLQAFADPMVDAVAGRTCNQTPGEESAGVEAIGRVLPNGDLTGNFAADPGSLVAVDHGIGANMSFRREVLAHLGGFRDDFRGIGGVREDTDVFLRLRALGRRAVFAPDAAVDHIGAPHVRGRRFDYRYNFFLRYNHALLLARNFGLGSREFQNWAVGEIRGETKSSQPNVLRRAARAGVRIGGVIAGAVASLPKARWQPVDPVRRDRVGETIRRQLSDSRARPHE